MTDDEITERPNVPIRAGGIVQVSDLLDLLEATGAGEGDIFYVTDTSIEAGR